MEWIENIGTRLPCRLPHLHSKDHKGLGWLVGLWSYLSNPIGHLEGMMILVVVFLVFILKCLFSQIPNEFIKVFEHGKLIGIGHGSKIKTSR